MARRWVILAPSFATRAAKTAHGVIAYGREPVVAVVDPELAGRAVSDVLPHLGDAPIPIVGGVEDGIARGATALLIGIAPQGGGLPETFRSAIATALDAGLEVVSGLHTRIATDPMFAARARDRGTTIVELREPPPQPLFSGAAYAVAPVVVLTVGSDCAVGKMTVSLELTRAAAERGADAGFVPTGQTGIAIAGWGTAIDRVIADFAPGAAEALVIEGARRHRDLLFVEGQGGINHPAYAPVTLALLYGSAPDALVLVHLPTRTAIEGFDVPLLSYGALIATYEALCATVKPARVVAIALNTRELEEPAARAEIARARRETGLPADDVVRFGPHALYDAFAPQLAKGAALRA